MHQNCRRPHFYFPATQVAAIVIGAVMAFVLNDAVPVGLFGWATPFTVTLWRILPVFGPKSILKAVPEFKKTGKLPALDRNEQLPVTVRLTR